MGLFDPRPGKANSVAPFKRPLSNMTPIVVLRDDLTYCSLGSSGGREIINTLSLFLINLLIYGEKINYVISAPKVHTISFSHVYLDSKIKTRVELKLIKEGYKTMIVSEISGSVTCILVENGGKLLTACERGMLLGI